MTTRLTRSELTLAEETRLGRCRLCTGVLCAAHSAEIIRFREETRSAVDESHKHMEFVRVVREYMARPASERSHVLVDGRLTIEVLTGEVLEGDEHG